MLEDQHVLVPGNAGLVKTDANEAQKFGSRAYLAAYDWSAAEAVASSVAGVHAAVADTGSQQIVTTGFTNPPCPRNATATAGGTNTDIKAIQVTVGGTDMNDQRITETLPAFTADTAGTVQGSKIFKTIDSATIPAHDGTGATTSIGFGNKLGLPWKMSRNGVLATFLNNVKEGTAPTVATSTSDLASNSILLNSSLNGTPVRTYVILP